MNTKLVLRFAITHPDADLRFHDFQQSPDPLLDFWQAVGAVFAQMLEQMDDRSLAAALERRAIAREGLYDAASDERGLTVLDTAQSALAAFLEAELGEDGEVEIIYA
jgi:hypothetical protein